MNHTKIILHFNILNPLSKENRNYHTYAQKIELSKWPCKKKARCRYFLIKLVTWRRKQDLRVVDKYFLIKLVTWTRNEIVNTYQSRSGKNQINFFCLYNQSTEKMRECVTRDEGRVEGGGNTPKVWNPKMCDLCEVTCQGSRKKSPGTCATVR